MLGAQQVLPIVFSGLAGTERGRIGLAGAGTQASGLNISAEPLRELLARQFEELYRRPFTQSDYAIAQDDDRLRPILEEMRRFGVQFGAESAVEAQEREEFLADMERQLGLPETARQILGGSIQAVKGFNQQYDELQSIAAAAAARDFFGRERREPETVQDQDYRAWQEIRPQQYLDPETREVDWGAYWDVKDPAFARLPLRLQQAIEARIRGEDPGVVRVAGVLKAWRSELDPYYDISLEERGGSAERIAFREDEQRIDAILWLTGSVSKVRTYGARREAIDLARERLGITLTPNDVPRVR